jgi:hypothetical protein
MSTESLAFVSAALFEHSLVLLLVGITRRFCDPRKRLSTLIPKLAPPESRSLLGNRCARRRLMCTKRTT